MAIQDVLKFVFLLIHAKKFPITNKVNFLSFCIFSISNESILQGAISILSGKPQKFIDQFIYLDSNISSTESNVNICIGKA